MLGRCVIKFAAATLLVLVSVRPGWAQAPRSGPGPARPVAPSPFARNAMGIEIAGALLTEAWNSNGTHEVVGEGTFGINWCFAEGIALVVQFHAAGIAQAAPRAAFLNGFAPNVRFRLFSRRDFTWFVDVGAGVSWSDTTTPPRGTRFNFLLIASSGFMYKLKPQIYAVASARLLHLSNASLFGRDRNPDIEALGGTFGIYFAF